MIKLEASQDKLRLVIPAKYYPPRYLYLDFPDKLQYYPLAHQIKRLMEIDIATDSFDRSLEKYKPQKSDTLNNFTRRAWQGVLGGIEIRYRPPYNCRHTFITEMLQANIDVSTVAGWVGNSPEIIYRHYAGINDIEVPRI